MAVRYTQRLVEKIEMLAANLAPTQLPCSFSSSDPERGPRSLGSCHNCPWLCSSGLHPCLCHSYSSGPGSHLSLYCLYLCPSERVNKTWRNLRQDGHAPLYKLRVACSATPSGPSRIHLSCSTEHNRPSRRHQWPLTSCARPVAGASPSPCPLFEMLSRASPSTSIVSMKCSDLLLATEPGLTTATLGDTAVFPSTALISLCISAFAFDMLFCSTAAQSCQRVRSDRNLPNFDKSTTVQRFCS